MCAHQAIQKSGLGSIISSDYILDLWGLSNEFFGGHASKRLYNKITKSHLPSFEFSEAIS